MKRKSARDSTARPRTDKEWRKFEIAVKQLEAVLRPHGYALESPDKLWDHDIDAFREVDCSIRDLATGAVISVECRRRSKTQDVTWIEQLACKRDSLRLAGTIAVSSKGYSLGAVKKAEKHGITLKTFREVVEPEVLAEFRRLLQINHLRREGTLVSASIETQNDDPDDGIQAFIANLTPDTPVLHDARTDRTATIRDLLELSVSKFDMIDPGSRQARFNFAFMPDTVRLCGFPVPIFLKSLTLEVRMTVTRRAIERVALHQYATAEEILLEVASAEMDTAKHGQVNMAITFKRLPNP